MRRRLLLHSDSLCATTGFSRVASTIVGALDDWQVTQVAVNHPGPLVRSADPRISILPARLAGNDTGHELIREMYRDEDFDILVIVQDLHVAAPWADGLRSAKSIRSLRRKKPCPILFHFPVDGPMLGDIELIDVADLSVVPTRWAGSQLNARALTGVSRPPLTVVPHAVDTTVFAPLPSEERRELRLRVFGVGAETLAVLWLGTNTDRKDPFTALASLRALSARGVAVKLYMHTRACFQGLDIPAMARSLGLGGLHVAISDPSLLGCSPTALNALYNAADALLFTAKREGFGIPMIEAMAAGLPVVAPDYVSDVETIPGRGPFHEVLRGGELGWLHESEGARSWTRGDSRGPGWLSVPDRVASALCTSRDDPERAERLAAARTVACEVYDEQRIRGVWRSLVYDLLMESRE